MIIGKWTVHVMVLNLMCNDCGIVVAGVHRERNLVSYGRGVCELLIDGLRCDGYVKYTLLFIQNLTSAEWPKLHHIILIYWGYGYTDMMIEFRLDMKVNFSIRIAVELVRCMTQEEIEVIDTGKEDMIEDIEEIMT